MEEEGQKLHRMHNEFRSSLGYVRVLVSKMKEGGKEGGRKRSGRKGEREGGKEGSSTGMVVHSIPVLRRQKEVDLCEFWASQDYTVRS